jgi:hypothetical protein
VRLGHKEGFKLWIGNLPTETTQERLLSAMPNLRAPPADINLSPVAGLVSADRWCICTFQSHNQAQQARSDLARFRLVDRPPFALRWLRERAQRPATGGTGSASAAGP